MTMKNILLIFILLQLFAKPVTASDSLRVSKIKLGYYIGLEKIFLLYTNPYYGSGYDLYKAGWKTPKREDNNLNSAIPFNYSFGFRLAYKKIISRVEYRKEDFFQEMFYGGYSKGNVTYYPNQIAMQKAVFFDKLCLAINYEFSKPKDKLKFIYAPGLVTDFVFRKETHNLYAYSSSSSPSDILLRDVYEHKYMFRNHRISFSNYIGLSIPTKRAILIALIELRSMPLLGALYEGYSNVQSNYTFQFVYIPKRKKYKVCPIQ